MIAETELGRQRSEAIRRFFEAIQAGDFPVLLEVLTPDAITRWPQPGERIAGVMACVRIYENDPGGPPKYRLQRITGDGDIRVAELVGNHGDER